MLTFLTVIALAQAAPAAGPVAGPVVGPDAPAAPLPPPQGCVDGAYAAFDFWVGEWEVSPAREPTRIVARSRIERLHDGCAIREQWMPLRGGGGSSISARDPRSGLWHQTWVGSAPGAVYFSGGPVDGGMVLTGHWPGQNAAQAQRLIRMTYTANADGSVRQFGQSSDDHGVSWQPAFDFIYRPAS